MPTNLSRNSGLALTEILSILTTNNQEELQEYFKKSIFCRADDLLKNETGYNKKLIELCISMYNFRKIIFPFIQLDSAKKIPLVRKAEIEARQLAKINASLNICVQKINDLSSETNWKELSQHKPVKYMIFYLLDMNYSHDNYWGLQETEKFIDYIDVKVSPELLSIKQALTYLFKINKFNEKHEEKKILEEQEPTSLEKLLNALKKIPKVESNEAEVHAILAPFLEISERPFDHIPFVICFSIQFYVLLEILKAFSTNYNHLFSIFLKKFIDKGYLPEHSDFTQGKDSYARALLCLETNIRVKKNSILLFEKPEFSLVQLLYSIYELMPLHLIPRNVEYASEDNFYLILSYINITTNFALADTKPSLFNWALIVFFEVEKKLKASRPMPKENISFISKNLIQHLKSNRWLTLNPSEREAFISNALKFLSEKADKKTEGYWAAIVNLSLELYQTNKKEETKAYILKLVPFIKDQHKNQLLNIFEFFSTFAIKDLNSVIYLLGNHKKVNGYINAEFANKFSEKSNFNFLESSFPGLRMALKEFFLANLKFLHLEFSSLKAKFAVDYKNSEEWESKEQIFITLLKNLAIILGNENGDSLFILPPDAPYQDQNTPFIKNAILIAPAEVGLKRLFKALKENHHNLLAIKESLAALDPRFFIVVQQHLIKMQKDPPSPYQNELLFLLYLNTLKSILDSDSNISNLNSILSAITSKDLEQFLVKDELGRRTLFLNMLLICLNFHRQNFNKSHDLWMGSLEKASSEEESQFIFFLRNYFFNPTQKLQVSFALALDLVSTKALKTDGTVEFNKYMDVDSLSFGTLSDELVKYYKLWLVYNFLKTQVENTNFSPSQLLCTIAELVAKNYFPVCENMDKSNPLLSYLLSWQKSLVDFKNTFDCFAPLSEPESARFMVPAVAISLIQKIVEILPKELSDISIVKFYKPESLLSEFKPFTQLQNIPPKEFKDEEKVSSIVPISCNPNTKLKNELKYEIKPQFFKPVEEAKVIVATTAQQTCLNAYLQELIKELRKLDPNFKIYLYGSANACMLLNMRGCFSLELKIIAPTVSAINLIKAKIEKLLYVFDCEQENTGLSLLLAVDKAHQINMNLSFVKEIEGTNDDELITEFARQEKFNIERLFTYIPVQDNQPLEIKGFDKHLKTLRAKQLTWDENMSHNFLFHLQLVEYGLRVLNNPRDEALNTILIRDVVQILFSDLVKDKAQLKEFLNTLASFFFYEEMLETISVLNSSGIISIMTGLEMAEIERKKSLLIPYMLSPDSLFKASVFCLFLFAELCLKYKSNPELIEELDFVKVLRQCKLSQNLPTLDNIKSWCFGESSAAIEKDYNFKHLLEGLRAEQEEELSFQF